MSENLQRQAGITETTVGLTAKAQTPGELILEVMDGEMDASIHRTGVAMRHTGIGRP